MDFIFYSEKTENRAFIKCLLEAEIEYCREEDLMRETLRQLTFMLYSIWKVEDIPILFEAKMDTSFDAGCSLDIELIFGKNKEEIKSSFRVNKNNKYDIVGCIEEYEKYNFQTPDEFTKGMERYYKR